MTECHRQTHTADNSSEQKTRLRSPQGSRKRIIVTFVPGIEPVRLGLVRNVYGYPGSCCTRDQSLGCLHAGPVRITPDMEMIDSLRRNKSGQEPTGQTGMFPTRLAPSAVSIPSATPSVPRLDRNSRTAPPPHRPIRTVRSRRFRHIDRRLAGRRTPDPVHRDGLPVRALIAAQQRRIRVLTVTRRDQALDSAEVARAHDQPVWDPA